MQHTEFPLTSFSQASRAIANESQSYKQAVLFSFKEISRKLFGSIDKLGLYNAAVLKSGDADLLKILSERERTLLWYAVAAEIISSLSDQELAALFDYWKDIDREVIRIVDYFVTADRILLESEELDLLEEQKMKADLTTMAKDEYVFEATGGGTLHENVSAFLLSLLLKLPLEQLVRVTSVIYDEL